MLWTSSAIADRRGRRGSGAVGGRPRRMWNGDETESMRGQGLPEEGAEHRKKLSQGTQSKAKLSP
jgi:hypothetical protein